MTQQEQARMNPLNGTALARALRPMKNQLLPCPFCCSANVEDINHFGLYFSVRCHDCTAEGPRFELRKKVNGLWPREAAKKAWNERNIRP